MGDGIDWPTHTALLIMTSPLGSRCAPQGRRPQQKSSGDVHAVHKYQTSKAASMLESNFEGLRCFSPLLRFILSQSLFVPPSLKPVLCPQELGSRKYRKFS